MRTTLDPGQLTDADDRFQIKPVLAYFKAAWELHEAKLTVWTADLKTYTQIVEGVSSEDVVPTRSLFFYTNSVLIATETNLTKLGLDFVNNVLLFLNEARRFVAAEASADEARIVSLSQNEIKRFEDDELTSWTAMLEVVNALVEKLTTNVLSIASVREEQDIPTVWDALIQASEDSPDIPSTTASEALRRRETALLALETSALYQGLVLAQDLTGEEWWVLFD